MFVGRKTWVRSRNASAGSVVTRGDALPITVDSICASPAATTPALKSTLGVKPSVSSSVDRKPTRETTLLTCGTYAMQRLHQRPEH